VRLFLLLFALICSADAAVIKGIVLDNMSGRPLARTRVVLQIVGRDSITARSTSTGSNGQFEFDKLAAGWCLVSADRMGFATAHHGQKLWNSPGVPLHVDEDSSTFLTLRMRRLGAITGTVFDENDVGLPQVDVLAFRDTRPPSFVARTQSDDRGNYRIGMLEPGRYLIRTGPKRFSEDFNLVPTFHREAQRLDEALPVDVRMEEYAGEVNVKPEPGKLVSLDVECANPWFSPVPVLLVSETGRIRSTTNSAGRVSFHGLAPGQYEVFAGNQGIEAVAARAYWQYGEPQSAYTTLSLVRDREDLRVGLRPTPTVRFYIRDSGGTRIQPDAVTVWLRRKDLAGPGEPQRRTGADVRIPPGRWEVRIETPPDMYPVSLASSSLRTGPPGIVAAADSWTEMVVWDSSAPILEVVVSRNPATIHGKVTASVGEAAVGAPVYLERWDEREGKRLGEIRRTLTGAQGGFSFRGLGPGAYRLVSSFDFDAPGEELMPNVQPKLVRVAEGENVEADLALFVMQ